MTAAEVAALERCIAAGGVALFPSDTVYGLAADPESERAVERLYRIKGRPPRKPAAVMWLDVARALDALDAGPRTHAALGRLLPGPVTAIVANPRGLYPLACADTPDRLGVRVPALAGELAPLAAIERPLLQSSANRSGASDARRLADVDPAVRAAVDCALDGGELPGIASTVVDLSDYETSARWSLVRAGALPGESVSAAL